MKYYAVAWAFAGLSLHAQILAIPISPNPSLSQPAVDSRAMTAIVSSSVSPDGQIHNTSDLYLLRPGSDSARQLTKLENRGATWVDISSDGSKAAYNLTALTPPGVEEVHIVDTASGSDRTVAVDTVGCIQPLLATVICLGCFFSCVRTVHLSPDASKVVYSASQTQSLYVVNADGSGAQHLPIDRAVLAPSPQRVVSRNGLLVFTTGLDVFSANLDGSDMRNLSNFETGVAGASAYVSNATVSEDGATIAFQRQVTSLASQPRAYSQIYILRPGAAPRQFTVDPLDSSSPSISADGSLVAFIQAGQAFLQRTDGSTPPVRLTTFRYLTAVSVTLSADGSMALVSTGSSIYSVATGMTAKRLFGPRAILPNGIASYSGMARPSPGSLFRISGWNLQDDDIVLSQRAPLSTSLGGVSVSVNGQPAPLVSVTPTQITAQLPFTIPAGDTRFAVDFSSGPEATALAEVKDAAPEVLQYVQPFFGSFYAMAFHAGTSTPADQGHPAAMGETLEMYGLGLGAVTPQVNAGTLAPSSPPARAIVTPRVRIGNQDATVNFAGLAPGMIGIYQVNAIVPSGLKSGSQPVSWSVAGQSPSVNWTLWLK